MRGRMLAGMVAIAALVLSGCSFLPDEPDPTSSEPAAPRLPRPADPLPLSQVAAYSSVAAMNAGSNCTGTLIDTGVADGPAYVLTNGHCVGDVGRPAQTTTLGQDWSGTAEFFRARGNLDSTYEVDVVQLAYSTMRETDTAVVRLDATLGGLEKAGVRPVRIADDEPAEGAEVVNVGVPVQNLDDRDWVMRKGRCTLGSPHTVIEFAWLWHGVWSNDCPGIIQGSSGSPLFETDATGPTRIVGMINTTSAGVTAAQGGACWLNRPCQVSASGPVFVEDTSYAQSVAGIGRCFDRTTGVFSIGGACPLPVGNVWATQGGGQFRGGDAPDAVGRTPSAILVGRKAGTVRTALVPIGDGTACARAATYASSPARPLPKAGKEWDLSVGLDLPVELPEVEGFSLLCAVRDDDYAGAASVLFEVDRTPPRAKAAADVERLDGAVVVRPHLDPPEISTVRFTWGRKGKVDCDDTPGFQDFFVVPLTIERADLPATYCIYGMDGAGNRTPVTRIEIPRR